jgi:hypothetical protein
MSPNAGGGGSQPLSTAVYHVHGAQENMRDLTTYITYGWIARGRIVQGTQHSSKERSTRPREKSSKGHVVHGTHHPKTFVRRHTNQGRIDPTVSCFHIYLAYPTRSINNLRQMQSS